MTRDGNESLGAGNGAVQEPRDHMKIACRADPEASVEGEMVKPGCLRVGAGVAEVGIKKAPNPIPTPEKLQTSKLQEGARV